MSIFYEGWQWMLRMLFSIVKKYKNDLNVHKTLGLLFEAVLLMSLTSERRSAMQCGVAWSVARSVAWSVPTQILMQVVICGQLMITTLPTSPVSTNHIIPNIKCTAESQAATYCIVSSVRSSSGYHGLIEIRSSSSTHFFKFFKFFRF